MTIYNPHQLTRAELVAQVVARQPLLAELLDDLRRGGAQHHLLIGERGAGKTTLLLQLAAAIDDDAHLSKKCIALRFPEEQYNLTSLADLWTNCAAALVEAYERRGETERATHLATALAALMPLAADARAQAALALLVQTKKPRRTLVLLLDNVDLVLDRLRDQQWALREVLSADNGLVVIGASSRLLEDTTAYEAAFYDFFMLRQLAPLTEAEARALIPTLDRGTYILTGGSPRLLALGGDLDHKLDVMTPYYKARLDSLPPQSQVIVDAVAQHWHPITAAACAESTRLEINVVSAQLSRLVKSGLVAKVSLPDGSKLGFQLADRFWNLWYLMRAGGRPRSQLASFVRFVAAFYTAGPHDVRALVREHGLETLLADGAPLAPEARTVADDVRASLSLAK